MKGCLAYYTRVHIVYKILREYWLTDNFLISVGICYLFICTKMSTELKAIQDSELHKGPDYHYLSRPERYSEGVRKASHFVSCVRDKTLDGRIDAYYFGQSVKICFLDLFH